MDITEQLTHESRIALAAAAEITRLRARLEVRDDGGPDGILCRDESIRMQDAEIARLRAEVEALKAEDARLRKTWQKENDELVQILGKALQYPRFVDDQSVFPGATEADGVCVPCHTALSIADEAAEKIEALKADNRHLRGEFEKAWPDAERYRHLISAEPAWVVGLFENGFKPAEIVDLIDAARAALEKK